MKFYHYAPKDNNVLQNGLCGFASSPKARIADYARSGKTTQAEITQWMEEFFTGYSRGIRCFSEPIKYYPHSLRLKTMIEACDLFEIDADTLQQDHLLEKIYINPALSLDEKTRQQQWDKIQEKHNDGFYPIELSQIPKTPVNWTVCDDKTGRRFAFVPFYMLIVKDGVIPPKYLKKL